MYDLVVKGRIFMNGALTDASICINDGLISDIRREAPSSSSAGEVMNFGRKIILPGVIDTHVHMRDPGLTTKEDFGTGSISAAFGGVTTILDMPNTVPPTVDRRSYIQKMEEAEKKSVVDFGLYLAIVDDSNESTVISSFRDDWGRSQPTAFKCFLGESTGKLTLSSIEDLKRWIDPIHRSGKPLAVHAEDGDILTMQRNREFTGGTLFRHNSKRPPNAEKSAVNRAVKVSGSFSDSLHFLHISTEMGLTVAAGTGATIEVTPHHLLLDLKWSEGFDRSEMAKVNPPIRKRSDRSALWQGIEDNRIDTIGSDHAPHEIETKKDGMLAPSGMPGVETMLPLLLRKVVERKISLPRLIQLLCTNPAAIYNIEGKGKISPGSDADLSVIDLSDDRIIRAEDLHSKCGWTCFEGMKGVFPSHVISRGDLLIENDIICVKKGRGRVINTR